MDDEGNNLTSSQEQMLMQFVDQLIDEKKIPKTDRLRAELKEKLTNVVLTEILMNLPDYLLDKINKATDEDHASDELIEQVINESGIDTTQITEKAMINFREEYLGKTD